MFLPVQPLLASAAALWRRVLHALLRAILCVLVNFNAYNRYHSGRNTAPFNLEEGQRGDGLVWAVYTLLPTVKCVHLQNGAAHASSNCEFI